MPLASKRYIHSNITKKGIYAYFSQKTAPYLSSIGQIKYHVAPIPERDMRASTEEPIRQDAETHDHHARGQRHDPQVNALGDRCEARTDQTAIGALIVASAV
jgi:hypothetical protein